MNRSILHSLAHQTAWESAGKLFRFLALIFIARYLGVDGFSTFALVVTFVEIMNAVFDLKLDSGIVRQVTRGTISKNRAFGNALTLKICSGAGAVFISFPIFYLLTGSLRGVQDLTCAILGLPAGQLASLARIVFQLQGILEKSAIARTAGGFVLFAGAYILSLMEIKNARPYLVIYALSWITEAAIALWLCRFIVSFKLTANMHIIKKILAEGIFFTIMNGIVIFYYKIDTLLMEVFRGHQELGLYNAAYRLLDVCMFIPAAVGAIFYPVMLRSSKTELAGWNNGQKAMDFLIGFAVPFVFFIYFARHIIIDMTYGNKFLETGDLLGVLAISIIFLYPSLIISQALIVAGEEKKLMKIHIFLAVCSVFVYCITIQRYGTYGAAWATVILEAVFFFSVLSCLRRSGIHPQLGRFFEACLISLPIAITANLITYSNWLPWIKIFFFICTGIPAIIWLMVITLREWKDVLE